MLPKTFEGDVMPTDNGIGKLYYMRNAENECEVAYVISGDNGDTYLTNGTNDLVAMGATFEEAEAKLLAIINSL